MPVSLADLAPTLMGWLLTPLGAALGVVAVVVWRRAARWQRGWTRAGGRVVAGLLVGLACSSSILGGYGLWIRYRPHPPAVERVIHPGIVHRRFSRLEPRPLVVHVATIDLDVPGLELVPTPPATGECLPAQTTSGFLVEQGLQLAVNAQFFSPCSGSSSEAEGELEEGRPLHPIGEYVVAGEVVVARPWLGNTLYVGTDGTLTMDPTEVTVHHAISGRHRLVEGGEARSVDDGLLAPRVALGVDATGRHLTIVLVDGRQHGYSEGVTLPELAQLLVGLGAHDAIELDGGGSATLVAEEDGAPVVLNSPIHERIPGRERPVANHLGVRVARPR